MILNINRHILIVFLFLLCKTDVLSQSKDRLQNLTNKIFDLYKDQKYDSAIVISDILLSEAEKNTNTHYIIVAAYNKAQSLSQLNKTKEAADFYYKALRLCADTSERKQKAGIYNNLGVLNFNQGNITTAKQYFREEINLKKQIGDPVLLVNGLINLSAMHLRLKEYDSSSYVLNEVEIVLKKLNKPKLSAHYFLTRGNYFRFIEKLDSAAHYYNKSLAVWLQLNNKEEALRPLFNLGNIYHIKGEFKKALNNYLQANEITDSLKLLPEKIKVCGNIAELYYDIKEFKQSADLFRTYIELKDSLRKKDINAYAIQLDKQFKTEKEIADYAIKLDKQFQTEKNKEIIQQQKLELSEHKNRLYLSLFIVALCIITIIIIVVYLTFKKRLRIKTEDAKKKFFSNVVHEIRTPLSMISAPLKLLKPKLNSTDDLYNIDMAEKSIGRLNELINQMLDISKIESSKYTLTETFGDLELFFNQMIKNYSKMASEKNIVFLHQLQIGSKTTFFDKDALEKITGNLLSNAIKYTPEGSQAGIDIYTEEREAGINLVINVWDTGPGISEKEQEKIFNRFYRSSNVATSTKGVGIGLSLVKELVELLRGDIELKSAEGKGAVFTVNILLKNKDEKTNFNISSASFNNETKSRILIAEDDADILDFNANYLEKNELKVLKAHNGKEAIDLLEKTLPDLIITDLMMPQMDGLSFLKTIKSNPASDHIPVIILSAKTSAESRMEALKLGAQAYISKPFLPDELLTLVLNQIEIVSKKKNEFKELIQQADIKTEEKFTGTEPYTKKLFKIVFEQLDNPDLSVEALADLMATNRSHFQRKVKAITGLSPSEIIKTIRLEKAKELLLAKSGNITEVAYSTGFSSQSYFTRCFTQHFGISPTQMLHGKK